MYLDTDRTYSRVRSNLRPAHAQRRVGYGIDDDVRNLANFLRQIDLSDAIILASQLGSILFGVVYLWQQGTSVLSR